MSITSFSHVLSLPHVSLRDRLRQSLRLLWTRNVSAPREAKQAFRAGLRRHRGQFGWLPDPLWRRHSALLQARSELDRR